MLRHLHFLFSVINVPHYQQHRNMCIFTVQMNNNKKNSMKKLFSSNLIFNNKKSSKSFIEEKIIN